MKITSVADEVLPVLAGAGVAGIFLAVIVFAGITLVISRSA